MMNYRVIQKALIETLGAGANGNFRIAGYRGQGHDAKEVKDSKRLVQAYYSVGEYSKSSGRQTGPTQHDPVFNIDFSVSASAKVDLSVLSDQQASAAKVQAALSASTDAAFEADCLLDEVMDLAYQILMDGRNFDLGLGKGVMSSRWVDRGTKFPPQPHGGLMVLTGQLQYSCRTVELAPGEKGTPIGAGGINTKLDIHGDDVEQTEVSTR